MPKLRDQTDPEQQRITDQLVAEVIAEPRPIYSQGMIRACKDLADARAQLRASLSPEDKSEHG